MIKAVIIIDMVKRDVDNLWNKKSIVKNQLKLMSAFKTAGHKVIIVGGGLGKKRKPNPVMLRLWGDETKKNGIPRQKEENELIKEVLTAPHDWYLRKP
jgi:hypothetical protein